MGIIQNGQFSRNLHQRLSELCFLEYAQDMLNILCGSLFEHEQERVPVILRVEEQFSDEGLTDGEWKNR